MEKEMEYCLERMKSIQKKLLNGLDCALDKGVENVNAQEAGEIADMIKDLSEAEEKCHKACYYKSIYEAMAEHKERYGWYPTMPEELGEGRYGWRPPMPMYNDDIYGWYTTDGSSSLGYNNGSTRGGNGSYGYRTSQSRDSQGRFTSEGGGRMGYHDGMRMNRPESEYGRAYDMYQESRRHFTETGSTTDREEMNQHAKEHLDATIATMSEIYKSSDPELKRQIKSNIGKLIGDMN